MSTISTNRKTQAVNLPAPYPGGVHAHEGAPEERRSTLALLPDPLPVEQVSALLWAGRGINRPGSWGRTAPAPQHWHEVTVYALLPEGTYRYDPHEHRLLLVKAADLRASTDASDLLAIAPLHLVYVVDFDRIQLPNDEEHGVIACADADADAGRIVENVFRYCAGAGLATAVRGVADRSRMARALGLKPSQRIALAQIVGYPQPTAH